MKDIIMKMLERPFKTAFLLAAVTSCVMDVVKFVKKTKTKKESN